MKGYINEKEIYKLFQGTPGIARLHVAQIDELPRADVVEVKHAYRTLNVGHRSYCSNCGRLAVCENYCSLCGAKMDGGEK